MLFKHGPVLQSVGEASRLIESLFDDFGMVSRNVGVPETDMVEDAEAYQLFIDLPGVKKEDVSLSTENRTLTISARRSDRMLPEGARLIHRETFADSMQRTMEIPATVDVARISAELRDGVLRIEFPKEKAARVRQIEIHTSGQTE